MIGRYLHDVEIAVESIKGNKLKSFLTALGIIFGVAAVISMLAIGNGAQKEILDQMKLVGANNIIINPLQVSRESDKSDGDDATSAVRRFSPGLTRNDIEAVRSVLPTLRYITPIVQYEGALQYGDSRLDGRVVGVDEDYFSIYHLPLDNGSVFTREQADRGAAVCVIGSDIRAHLFGRVNPIGQHVKFGHLWFEVVGVLARSGTQGGDGQSMGVQVYNTSIFTPQNTLTLRYRQRGRILRGEGGLQMVSSSGNHELDQIIIQVDEPENMVKSQEIVQRLLGRLHQGVEDFAVIVPEQLLKQQQRTKDIFNLVLGAIAGISLLVGGIGIMNIMFASVLERIKEIGTRLAIGAKKADIVAQFLSESVLISVSGGIIGVLLGVGLSALISRFAGIETIVSVSSVVVAFGVSAAVGVIFGFAPARQAASKNPIESLRYE